MLMDNLANPDNQDFDKESFRKILEIDKKVEKNPYDKKEKEN